METSEVKQIILSKQQLMLAYTIVRVHEANYFPRPCRSAKDVVAVVTHQGLVSKLARTSPVMVYKLSVAMHFTDPECQLMRQYNTDYCAILATKFENQDDADPPFLEGEYLELYQLATSLQTLFSSFK